MNLSTITLQESILVVDDNSSDIKQIFQYLAEFGYEVLVSPTLEKTLELAKLTRPSLIILDAISSGIDKASICRMLKQEKQTCQIPVIFVTASTAIEPEISGFEFGAVDYIAKPVKPQELLTRIKNHLTASQLNQNLTDFAEQNKFLCEIANLIKGPLSIDFGLKAVIQRICNFMACDRLSLVRMTSASTFVEAQAYGNSHHDFFPVLNDAEFLKISRHHEHQLICDSERLSVEEISISRLFVPILLENSVSVNQHYPLWGWLLAEQGNNLGWSDAEQDFWQQLALQLSIAITQQLLLQQLDNSNRQLRINNRQLRQLVLYDPLTQVHNRRYFQQQLRKEWNRLRRTDAPLSIIFCNLDCFKQYNATYGYAKSDLCLQQVAEILARTIKRPADILARNGGDEFVVLLPDTNLQGAVQVAEMMRQRVKRLNITHSTSSVNSVITTSLGVTTVIPSGQSKAEFWITAAEQALCKAKKRGRDCIAVYQKPQNCSESLINPEQQLATRIRYALELDLFNLYAQPIASLKNDSRQRFEILLRLKDQGEQIFTPDYFLDVAERNSLMPNIDTWVFKQLLEQLGAIEDPQHWQNYCFSINLSGASLNDQSFLDFISQTLTQSAFSPELFCFEITETVAISSLEQTRDFMTYLKSLGCSFALDDFGKGMSSLNYLKNLPVDYLKIDGSFVSQLHQDKVSQVMVEAINHLAVGIGLKTVAEYVENQAILDTLLKLKIDYAQGYHFGRPQKFADVVSL